MWLGFAGCPGAGHGLARKQERLHQAEDVASQRVPVSLAWVGLQVHASRKQGSSESPPHLPFTPTQATANSQMEEKTHPCGPRVGAEGADDGPCTLYWWS